QDGAHALVHRGGPVLGPSAVVAEIPGPGHGVLADRCHARAVGEAVLEGVQRPALSVRGHRGGGPAVPQQRDRAPAIRAAERELTCEQSGEVPEELGDVLALQEQHLHGAQPVVPLAGRFLQHGSASSAGLGPPSLGSVYVPWAGATEPHPTPGPWPRQPGEGPVLARRPRPIGRARRRRGSYSERSGARCRAVGGRDGWLFSAGRRRWWRWPASRWWPRAVREPCPPPPGAPSSAPPAGSGGWGSARTRLSRASHRTAPSAAARSSWSPSTPRRSTPRSRGCPPVRTCWPPR